MLRRRVLPPTSTRRPPVVMCALGEQKFAVPVERVVEVARVASYTRLPCGDPTNLGVVLYRERLVPLVDLRPRLGLARAGTGTPPHLCVFVRSDAGEVGFPVDGVLGLAPAPGPEPGIPVLDLGAEGGFHG
jgi:purine-binding chemotaxis protein CheW